MGWAAAGWLGRAASAACVCPLARGAPQVGVLVARVGPHHWLSRWPDGKCAVYLTGAGGKFQLSYVTEHPQVRGGRAITW